jgi:hypothetical protein
MIDTPFTSLPAGMHSGLLRDTGVIESLEEAQHCQLRPPILDDPGLPTSTEPWPDPIEVLVGHFAVLKLDDAGEDELGSFTRGWQARKHPIHLERMGKANHELFDNPIVAEGLRQRSEIEVRRRVRQELMGVELAHSYPTHPARPGRNGEHIRISGPA